MAQVAHTIQNWLCGTRIWWLASGGCAYTFIRICVIITMLIYVDVWFQLLVFNDSSRLPAIIFKHFFALKTVTQ